MPVKTFKTEHLRVRLTPAKKRVWVAAAHKRDIPLSKLIEVSVDAEIASKPTSEGSRK